MSDLPKGAILQKDGETYAIVPKIPSGIITPEILETFSRVVKKYNIPIMKISSAQRIVLVGIKKDDVDKVWEEIGLDDGRPVGPCLHYIQSCPGSAVCKLGQKDSLGLASKIDELFSHIDIPAKTKIGVSGCPLSCGENYVRDIGLFGKKDKGWTILIGGNSGMNTRKGDVLVQDLSDEDTLNVLEKFFNYYIENAKTRERLYRFVPRVGIEKIKADLII
ncbi:Nitrite/Sulfite reductase ferredoxin-like half domain-containing protein [Desulfonispora thiosulfatigenes DSM 11270]|uniref:Nitrite/Sulfite reductase ferredoxin-like half domain-containing protein n=1 Tax=Desulfonispora thiosulfatigenes DSM 11270 TaxID=656914 RepID=A0A1W1VIP6_DESTI|nr:NAD(P)/FAD-dependent oxidoreductase [Desulfonispora thiosulfatigenes]SMB92814.1 Nitrite/Sulfite reductase ferredoxin-like half domain-containing protein [Desulfonispora thiosulfatigenes DSM 11270]